MRGGAVLCNRPKKRDFLMCVRKRTEINFGRRSIGADFSASDAQSTMKLKPSDGDWLFWSTRVVGATISNATTNCLFS